MTSALSVCCPLSQEHLTRPGARCPLLGRALEKREPQPHSAPSSEPIPRSSGPGLRAKLLTDTACSAGKHEQQQASGLKVENPEA